MNNVVVVIAITLVVDVSQAGNKVLYPDTRSLDKCHSTDYCQGKHALLFCRSPDNVLCRYRCPLGWPAYTPANTQEPRCGSVCPPGYFTKLIFNFEVCYKFSEKCPKGQSVILPGRYWHDRICGTWDDYTLLPGLWQPPCSKEFQNTLDTLTRAWLRNLPEKVIAAMCLMFFGSVTDACRYNIESLNQVNLQMVYSTLNTMAQYNAVQELHSVVLNPFITWPSDSEPTPRIYIGPLCIIGNQHVIPSLLTIPLGALSRYIPEELTLFYQIPMGNSKILLRANPQISLKDPRTPVVLSRGPKWFQEFSQGYLVHMFDLSLVYSATHQLFFSWLQFNVHITGKLPSDDLNVVQSMDFTHVWKPILHPDCNCTSSLLDYMNPEGLCSPTCLPMFGHFVHYIYTEGLSDNNWVLNITRGAISSSDTWVNGRILYGTVMPKTERFCIITTEIFNVENGLNPEDPGPPLDVTVCDVLVIEFEIWVGDIPDKIKSEHKQIQLPVRSLHKDNVESMLYIPLKVENVLKKIIAHDWVPKFGIKFCFLHRTRTKVRKHELAAVLDWMLTLSLNQKQAPCIAIISVNYMESKMPSHQNERKKLEVPLSHFLLVDKLYGSTVELMPVLSTGTIAHLIRSSGFIIGHHSTEESLDYFSHVRTLEQEQSENALEELGAIVALYGAFLDVDAISDHVTNTEPCNRVKPGRWTTPMSQTLLNTYAVSTKAWCPERTGVVVFEEMSRRSNNRAGLVITIPSSSYIRKSNTHWYDHKLVNRHNIQQYSNDTLIHYSLSDLEEIITDMAKWGVSRYSLGYLDYTFKRNARHMPTFLELSRAIENTATSLRALSYRYIRQKSYYDFHDTQVEVQGLFKLEAGIFFQLAENNQVPLVKSFDRVPGMASLRLGLSSAMNIGDGLTMDEDIYHNIVVIVDSIPSGVQVVHLTDTDNGRLAYVDWEKHVICVYTQKQYSPRETVNRFPSFCVKSTNSSTSTRDCPVYISGAEHRALVSVPLCMHEWPGMAFDQMVSQLTNWSNTVHQKYSLTPSEEHWLSNPEESMMTKQSCINALERGLFGQHFTATHLLTSVSQCIIGSRFCMDLGDYSENGWPRGGLGRAIAINVSSYTDGQILLKIIVLVRHGVLRSTIPCDVKTFSSESDPLLSRPMFMYYMVEDKPVSEMLKKYTLELATVTNRIVHPILSLFCPRNEQMGPGFPTLSVHGYLKKALACVTMRNTSLQDQSVYSFEKLIKVTEHVNLQKDFLSNTHIVCMCAIIPAVLINLTILVLLCYATFSKTHNIKQHCPRKSC